MMQEAARRGFDVNLIGTGADVQTVQCFHRRLRLTFGGAEGGEVVLTDQELRCGVHGLGVQLGGDVPDPPIVQRRRGTAVEDTEQVMP